MTRLDRQQQQCGHRRDGDSAAPNAKARASEFSP